MAKRFNWKLNFSDEITAIGSLRRLQTDFTWGACKSITIGCYPETNFCVACVDALQRTFHYESCHRCYCGQFSKTELQAARQRDRGMGCRIKKLSHFQIHITFDRFIIMTDTETETIDAFLREGGADLIEDS